MLIFFLLCQTLEAWTCPPSCNCTSTIIFCCSSGQYLVSPITGHENTSSLILNLCGHIEINSDSLQNFTFLEELIFNKTTVISISAYAFSALYSLRTLVLADANLSDATIDQNAFTGLKIKKLCLRNNQLHRVNWRLFAELLDLEDLNLSGNDIAFIEDQAFSKLFNLRILNLDNNHLKTLTPFWFGRQPQSNSSMKISLFGNEFSCECRYRGIQHAENEWFIESILTNHTLCFLDGNATECSSPQLTQVYQEVHTKEHMPLALPCVASGFPPPKIRWFLPSGVNVFDSPVPPFSNRNGTLTVDSMEITFKGLYACMATNIEGSAIGLYKLNVI
uniref:Ig-like domain-containing protein n=1 Tax=Latimeria chalumnae TaxID=7897 RepID=H3A2D8_LATCH